MPYYNQKNSQIYYQISGEKGPWITLINGYTRDSSDFKLFIKYLVQKNYRVLSFDNRGSGKSRCQDSFSLENIAHDILLIWDKSKIIKSHVIGFSMGGVVAQHLASYSYSRIDRLVLVSTACQFEKLCSQSVSFSMNLETLVEQLASYFGSDFVKKNRLYIELMAKQILAKMKHSDFLKNAEQQRHALLSYIKSAVYQPQLIQSTTLIIHGAKDQIITLSEAKQLAVRIKNSQLKIFSHEGHLLLAECSQKLYKEIADFFS